MREFSCRAARWGRALRVTAAVLLLGSGMAQAAAEKSVDGYLHHDARLEGYRAYRATPSLAQLQAVAALKSELPAVNATFREDTGATWTLQNYVGFLTAAAPGQDPLAVGLDYVRSNLDLFGLGAADLAEYEIINTIYSDVSGVTYVHLRQVHEGVPVYQGRLHFGVTKDGRLLMVNNSFVPELAGGVNAARPALSAAEAVLAAARFIGNASAAAPRELGEAKGVRMATGVDHAGISAEPIEASLVLLPVRRGDVRLAWNFQIHTADQQHVYDMTVDAVDGKVWTRFDWVDSDTYQVYNRPAESPQHVLPPLPQPPADGRTSVVNPAVASASPFGWHDTNGAAGAEFTITRGNNAHAYEDSDNNGAPPADESPYNCGPTLNCSFPINLAGAPNTYRPAAVANLFFWNNLIHDIQYQYGFNEAAANFQVNNYGEGGTGGDDVRAEAQDGGGINNANFLTLPEGQRPRMQMYLWNTTTPQRDGDVDNGVIIHEYGHGISNRLVGGGTTGCLTNTTQPGEGLSDWWALSYTGEIGDAGTNGRGIGTYVLGQPVTGVGIRTQRYSTDPAVNTFTFQSIIGMAVPHGVGSVWAQGAWEVYWRLVDNYGFDINLYNATGNAGNQRAKLYVNEGLKATSCNPGFIQVRDGIIAAATATHSGEDVCRIWAAFAGFGLGIDAVGSPNTTAGTTNGFLLPVPCRAAGPTGLAASATGANQISLTWNPVAGATSYRVYRANGPCPQATYNQIAQGLTSPSYVDNTVSGGNTYSYVVTQIDGSGVESGFSNCAQATATGGCTTPPTFAGLASVTSAGTQACALNLSWAAGTTGCTGSALKYNVYRSTTSGFVPGPTNLRQNCVNGTTFTDTTVSSGTTYYYVVRAEDSNTGGAGACNNGNTETNTVQRSGAPFGNTSATVTDNVESGNLYWSTAGGTGTNVWTIVTDLSNSPTHSWKVTDPAVVTDQRLTTVAAGNIPAGFTMSFFHRFNTEAAATPTLGYDGHVLEYSLDGTTWTDILAAQGPVPANPSRFIQNGYNRTISPDFSSPLINRQAWSGDNLNFQEVRVNLADFAGQSPFFRFRFASDVSVADVGVWIDDITFRAPGACGQVFIRGDFSGDGKTDILWRHDESGENVVWFMNGPNLTGGTFTTPATLTDVRWKMVGTHDFNGDLKTDILWRHNVAGENVLWYMNGTVLTSGEFLTPAALVDTRWQMAGTGDFNGDSKPDIAWNHTESGQIVLWYMNGSVLTSGTFTNPSSFDINYRLVGVADFSNPLDGKPDFVWRHQSTGANLVWFMNGADKIGEAFTTTLTDNRWNIVATGDYSFDGKNDFVWRHQESGENVMWFMNGAVLISGTFTNPASFPDVRWKMVGPR
jgi:extracellular elastinolytic metalloproteinase